MVCVFELPHIFIVFQPGTGGNFIAGLLSKLINSDSTDLYISNNGSSHTTIDRKVAGTDYMSLGTVFDDQTYFPSQEKRLNYYLEKIEELDGVITTPQVIWSHDFTNIPLYKNFFPNAKILVITQNSNIEKLVAVCMNVTKNLMDPKHTAPFPPKQWENIVKQTDFLLELGLRNIVGERSKDIVQNKFSDANHNIIKFIRLRQMLGYFGLLHLVDKRFPPARDVSNNVLFRTPWEEFVKNMNAMPYKIGQLYSTYITNDCVQLPYSHLIEGRANLLIDAVEALVGHLTDAERISIAVQFNKYRDMQDHAMLVDPIAYYANLERVINEK
jgi:hypothetical protein